MRFDTIIFYVLTENYKDSFVVCIDCYHDNDKEEYNETPVFIGSEWDNFPSCEWCNKKIKEGVKLI